MSTRPARRRGSVLPLVTILLVGLVGFVALAVALGMVAVCQTQCQNAADSAAIAGARALNGTASGNVSAATTGAQNVGALNSVLGKAIKTSEVDVQNGSYHYDYGTQKFTPQIPP